MEEYITRLTSRNISLDIHFAAELALMAQFWNKKVIRKPIRF